jgi:GTP-binding protein
MRFYHGFTPQNAIEAMNYNQTKFFKSAQKVSQVPAESRAEIAFAGRSNAGKSSALNALTNIKGLARTSKTPGRTQLLNFFQVTDHNFLVDLPGYGYAKVSHTVQKNWEKSLAEYVETREELRGICLIMDIRHPLQDYDQQMINWVISKNIPVHILLSKADKLNRGPAMNVLQQVRKELEPYGDLITVQLFSALKGQGLDEVRSKLDHWFTK